MTNREKFLKYLSNEELAYMFSSYCEFMDSCKGCFLRGTCCCANYSQEETVKWFESEVDDG